ncbi:hypothetical protein SERLA73DRAFT_50110 [Serpula lacrymans var. lacrymans S7.3]|uniref:Phosphotransferase n=2 Tax=Serpula lacrymans var. lacrymans TaxID=341189 RepID=F8PQF2_SERL3|nr:uncharacterized protein SERLADRAFT_434990 [Serpula lacrymans var. lacrymans S7.9]EGO01565.1 hypothetical protein SERLA73DRAFT_50110 [Serpula lacrymans var. lacrymans S7.3]EGO27219.1 hypothetical protein SERLADRAFT_434990 [Serpula lacrymans var. lacrymans S7.9]
MPTTSALVADNVDDILSTIHDQFTLDSSTLFKITKAFLREVSDGLSNYGHAMAMIPTFVKGVPNGSETGTFLALDLGGTNLRVCEVTLHGDKTFSLRQQKFRVSETLKTGEVTTLFDYLADSVDAFLTESGSPTTAVPPSLTPNPSRDMVNPLEEEEDSPAVPLGLTFSFPVEQMALDSGILLTWTKGFSAKNAIGKDIVKLLQNAFDRKHMHVNCVALVNDTVGALLSRAYTSGGCILGAIFGTGTNGAYVESVANIKKFGDSNPAVALGGDMIVNTEWGGFNNSRTALPTTPYDNKLDRESINPRYQAFEKFISGMYLGEIARNVILSLIDAAPRPVLFGGRASDALNKQWGLDTAVLSEIEEAWVGLGRFAPLPGKEDEDEGTRLERVRGVVVQRLGFADSDVSIKDAEIVRKVCSLVADRAAWMSGCAIAAVLVQTGRAHLAEEGASENAAKLRDDGQRIGVGVDGSLVEFYPNFETKMRESLRILVGPEVESRVNIGMAKDGSGVGAALCALVAIKQQHSLQQHTYQADPVHIQPQVSTQENLAYVSSMRS